ncbi:7TM diverse intracellular signaling domain-containing protein [Pseudomonadota bacterium]
MGALDQTERSFVHFPFMILEQRSGFSLIRFCIRLTALCGLLFLLSSISSVSAAADTISLKKGELVDLVEKGQLFLAENDTFPQSNNGIEKWLSEQQTENSIDLFGGAYWLYAEVRNDSDTVKWVLSPNGTLIETVQVRAYLQEGSFQSFSSGYRAEHDYSLHYGKRLNLEPGASAKILVHFDSTYYASTPRFEMMVERDFEQTALVENVLSLAAFGALLTLAIYNLFFYITTKDRAYFFYSAYLFAYFLGWAFTFHLMSELFGWQNLHLHYIPFFLLPALSTLFYIEFLQLKTYFPRLAKISRINYILPIMLMPSCFFALPYAHTLATLAITIWLVLALVSGIASLRVGFWPARYFVLAFIALWIPGAIILPANIGLIPDLVSNAELLTLLGGTLDAILLSFALADKIKILATEKDKALQQTHEMLILARTDHLTGIANRHAFDQAFEEAFNNLCEVDSPRQTMLLLIDLDGLKRVNDMYGHIRGDELLCNFAKEISRLETNDISVYRLGGDEFTILACKENETHLRDAMNEMENRFIECGFENTGVSYGVAYAHECSSAHEVLEKADQRMYKSKTKRRYARAEDGPLSNVR